MSSSIILPPGSVRLKLPATSANLGPGFDSLGLAMAMYLTINAIVAPDDAFSIVAEGRDALACSAVENNLILATYMEVMTAAGLISPRLHLVISNEIPLGMGCGSSAAALLAGVMLANHFGKLGWTEQQILEEASRREGHPDNIAACLLGGMTVSATTESSIKTATYRNSVNWNIMLALPSASLSTSKARALLPENYSKADAIANIQATALLVSAFAQGRGDLLASAMQDRIHQPYRMKACPLLPRLLPLAGGEGILGVALSGAGPSVLLIADPAASTDRIKASVQKAAGDPNLEVIQTKMAGGAEVLLSGD